MAVTDPLGALETELQSLRRRREEVLKNYAIYYLQMVPGTTAGTAREVTPEHVKVEIEHARDAHVDASVALLLAAVRQSHTQIAALRAEVGAGRRGVLGLAAGALVGSLATLAVVLLR